MILVTDIRKLIDQARTYAQACKLDNQPSTGNLLDSLADELEVRLPTGDDQEKLKYIFASEFKASKIMAMLMASAVQGAGFHTSPILPEVGPGEYTHAINLAEASRRVDEGGLDGLIDYIADLPTLDNIPPVTVDLDAIEAEAGKAVRELNPEWHDVGVGIVQGSHYRAGFVKGARWQAGRKE